MSDSVNALFLELMSQKLEILSEMLRFTELEHFTGEQAKFEDEAERFVNLIDKKNYAFEKINIIDARLSSISFDEHASDAAKQKSERDKIDSDIKQVVNKILDIDKKNYALAEDVSGKVKSGIRGIKVGRNVSTLYQTDYAITEGYHVDRKN